jgi:hypothetical protein
MLQFITAIKNGNESSAILAGTYLDQTFVVDYMKAARPWTTFQIPIIFLYG